MKQTPEYKAAVSLKKEYDMWMRYANKAKVPIEADYFRNMANITNSWIDWKLLERKPKEVVNENY